MLAPRMYVRQELGEFRGHQPPPQLAVVSLRDLAPFYAYSFRRPCGGTPSWDRRVLTRTRAFRLQEEKRECAMIQNPTKVRGILGLRER